MTREVGGRDRDGMISVWREMGRGRRGERTRKRKGKVASTSQHPTRPPV